MSTNPYPGPRPFEQAEAQWFHGRAEVLAELAELVQTYPVTLLYGRSGTGKTSLIQAGLQPALAGEGLASAYVRVAPESETKRDVFVRSVREAVGLKVSSSVGDWTADLGGVASKTGRHGLVLIIDQAEELFRPDGSIEPDCREAINELAGRCTRVDDGPRLTLLFAFREEALAGFDELAAVLPHGTGIRQRLAPLRVEDGEAVVGTPAKLVKSGPSWSSDAIRAVCEQASRDDGSLNALVLQCICRRVWEACANRDTAAEGGEITVDDVRRYGRVEDALSEFVHNAIATVASTNARHTREVLRFVERHFVSDGARHPLVWRANVPQNDEWRLLISLAESRLIIEHPAGNTVWFELAHEGLVGAVMNEAERHDPEVSRTRALHAQARRWIAGGYSSRDLLPATQVAQAVRSVRSSDSPEEVKQYVMRSADRVRRIRGTMLVVSLAGVAIAGALWIAGSVAREAQELRQVDGTIEWLQFAGEQSELEIKSRAEAARNILASHDGLVATVHSTVMPMLARVGLPVDHEEVQGGRQRRLVRLETALAAAVPWDTGVTRWRAPDAITAVAVRPAAGAEFVGTERGQLYQVGRPTALSVPSLEEPIVAALVSDRGLVAIGQSGGVSVSGLASTATLGTHLGGRVEIVATSADPDGSGAWVSLLDGRVCRLSIDDRPEWVCGGAELSRAFSQHRRVTLRALTGQHLLRYAPAGTLVEVWALERGRLAVRSRHVRLGVQGATLWTNRLVAGSVQHTLELLEIDGGARTEEIKIGGTPTVIENVRPDLLAVGMFNGRLQLFAEAGEKLRAVCKERPLKVSGETEAPVLWVQETAVDDVVVTVSADGVVSLVETTSCELLWQQATGLVRVNSVTRVGGRRFAAVGPGGEVALVDSDRMAGRFARVAEAGDGVGGAGSAGETWPVFLKGSQPNSVVVVSLPSGRRVALDELLFRGTPATDAVATEVNGIRYLVVVNSRGLFVVNLSEMDQDLPKIKGKLRQRAAEILPSRGTDLLSAAKVVAGRIVFVVGSQSRPADRLAYSVGARELVVAVKKATPLVRVSVPVGTDDGGQLDEVVKKAGGRSWRIVAEGEVVGVTDDGSEQQGARASLVYNPSRSSDSSPYQLVEESGATQSIKGLSHRLASRGVVAVPKGFAMIDTEGYLSVVAWKRDAAGDRRVPVEPLSDREVTSRDIGYMPGRGCTVATTADGRFVVAGGEGGVLVASVDGKSAETFPVASDDAVCAVALVSDTAHIAVKWVTQKGLQFSAPCRECTANRGIDESLEALSRQMAARRQAQGAR